MERNLNASERMLIEASLQKMQERISGFLDNSLTFSTDFELRLTHSVEKVYAIMESVPNPEFGKAPCHFIEPLVVIYHKVERNEIMLSASRKIFDNPSARAILKEEVQDLRNRDVNVVSYLLVDRR